MGSRTATYDWQKLRWKILERDDFTCRYCGQSAPSVVLEVDHKIAVVDGGTDDLDNLTTACRACNQGKEYSRWSKPVPESRLRKVSPHGEKLPAGRPLNENSAAGQVRTLLTKKVDITPAEVARAIGVSRDTAKKTLRRARQRTTGFCWSCGVGGATHWELCVSSGGDRGWFPVHSECGGPTTTRFRPGSDEYAAEHP